MGAGSEHADVRVFFWGLSNGVVVLAAAGAFWLMLAATSLAAAWRPADKYPFLVDGSRVGSFGMGVAMLALPIIAGAIRVRRKARGFSARHLRAPELAARARVIRRGFRWVVLAQWAGSALSVWLGMRLHREDLIWPGIGLVVSLHFLPLGLLFRMRPYIVAAGAGSVVSLTALVLPAAVLPPAGRFVLIGAGMALVVWTTAAYAILRADHLALRWAPGD